MIRLVIGTVLLTFVLATTVSPRDSCQLQGNFYCNSSNLCAPLSERCNGFFYCYYGEDEAGCGTTQSAPTNNATAASHYSPLNITTVPLSNPSSATTFPTTTDNTGFLSARNVCLSQGRFFCEISRACIYSSWRCDGFNDCAGNEDELSCTTSISSDTTLSPRDSCERQGNFYCAASNLCVSQSQRCNGYSYCYYGEDEVGCQSTSPPVSNNSTARNTCLSLGKYYCELSGGCISSSWRCDRINDCFPYNEDELNCPSTTSTATTLSPRDSCERQGNFYCAASNLCVSQSQRCNGYSNCYYGEDEVGCQTTSPPISNNATARNSCLSLGNYYCERSGGCIFSSWRCDRIPDCLPYNEDELNCPATTSSATTLSPRYSCESQGNFYCASSNVCVPPSQRCNGYSDCYYGEDEAGCSTSSPVPTTAYSSCGGTLYGSGYVRSPNYPNSYSNYLSCNWTLVANPYYGKVVIQFLALNTESCCDFVAIYNSTGLIYRYSGNTVPGPIVLGDIAFVTFTTDGSVVNSGFSIWFSTSVASPTTLSPRDSCEQEGKFYCSSSYSCISSWRRCDGYTDCYYREDETGCSSTSTATTPRTTEVTSSVRDSCLRQGNFYCEYSQQCVPFWYRCDGSRYCSFGEDELGCNIYSNRPDFKNTGSTNQLHRGCFVLVSGYIVLLMLALSRFGRR